MGQMQIITIKRTSRKQEPAPLEARLEFRAISRSPSDSLEVQRGLHIACCMLHANFPKNCYDTFVALKCSS